MDSKNLLRVRLRNDNLEVYLNEFAYVLLAQRKHLEDEMLESIFFEQIENSAQLKEIITCYKMNHCQDKTLPGPYEKLRKVVDNYVDEDAAKTS